MSRTDRPRGRAWADFFVENHRPLTAYALSLVGNMADGQDLIQDVLVRMVELERPVRAAKPFVLRCMRNLAIDRLRTRRARPTEVGLNDGGGGLSRDQAAFHVRAAFIDDQAGDLDRREAARRVKRALERLPTERREVVVLKIYAGLTFREVAEVLDRPMGTVTSHYARALEELRTLCDPELKHVVT